MGKSNSLEDIAVGFDDEACLEIDGGIEKVYSDTVNSIQINIKEEIVNQVATSWYSELAVDYFKTFQTACSNAGDDIKMVFQNFRDQMQSNINSWRTRTGDKSSKQLQDVAEKTITIDISKIKEVDNSGNRYISNTIEQDLSGWINTCRQLILHDISSSIAEKTVGSFIGENQNSTINSAMESLANVINDILCFLNTGDNSILTAIANYRKEYSETGKKVGIDTQQKDYGAGADTQGGADDGYSGTHNGGGNPGGNNPGGNNPGGNNPGGNNPGGNNPGGNNPVGNNPGGNNPGGNNPGGNNPGGNNPGGNNPGGNNPGGNNPGGNNPGGNNPGGNNPGGTRDPQDWRPSYTQQPGNQPVTTGPNNQPPPSNPTTNPGGNNPEENNPTGGNNPGEENNSGSNQGGGNNQGGTRDPQDWRPSYMQQPGNQPFASGTYNQTAPEHPMTLEEMNAQEKEKYNNMNDWERMLTRNLDQAGVGAVGWLESIIDFGGTQVVRYTGNKAVAEFVARDYEQETQNKYDEVHTDNYGRKYKDDTLLKTPVFTFRKSHTEWWSRLGTKVALDLATLKAAGAVGAASKGAQLTELSTKAIKAGYAAVKNIGDSGEQALGAATREGRNVQAAAQGASTAGAAKAALTMGADIGVDKYASAQDAAKNFWGTIAKRATMNAGAGLGSQLIQTGENFYSGDKTSPTDFAIGTLGKGAQSAFFGAIELGAGQNSPVKKGVGKGILEFGSNFFDAATD